MKVEKRIRTQEFPYEVYIANDGTEFTSSEECVKYDESARGVLSSRIKSCQISSNTEYEVLGTGSDEYYLIVYRPNNRIDCDNLLHYVKCGYCNEDNYNKLAEEIEPGQDIVLGKCSDDDSLYYWGTVEDYVNKIKSKLLNEAY